MTIMPSSTQTDIFAKANDNRDVSQYPTADQIAGIMMFQLSLPMNLEIKDLLVENRRAVGVAI
jgi:hypothetical protein